MSAIEELLRAKIVKIEADRDREAAKVDKLDKELADVKRERDDLKFVVDGHRPFNEWAQEYLDAGRWAGYRYCDGVMTELKERDEELASALKSNAHQADAYSSLNAAYGQLAEEHAKALEDNDAAMKAPKITDFEAQRSDPVESPNADDAYTVLDMPPDLHPQTKCLVWGFANALAAKLHKAEQKYGYSDGWRTTDWIASGKCREKLMEHIAKGDPRDVAAYCAFLWWHNASTVSNDAACSAEDSELAALVRKSYVLSCVDYGPEHEIRWLFELPMPAADGERFKKLAARAAQEERK